MDILRDKREISHEMTWLWLRKRKLMKVIESLLIEAKKSPYKQMQKASIKIVQN